MNTTVNLNTVCFNKNMFLLSVAALIGLTGFFLYTQKNKAQPSCPAPQACPACPVQAPSTSETVIISPPRHAHSGIIAPNAPLIDPTFIKDYNTINDPLSPPTKRGLGYHYSNSQQNALLNIHTSGYPDNYQLLGYLTRPSDGKVIKLFGRQSYPRGSKYEYYGIFNTKDQTDVKIEIKKGGYEDFSKEIYDKDEITVPFFDTDGTNPAATKFVAQINKTDRYPGRY
jgi:hypothetical protein